MPLGLTEMDIAENIKNPEILSDLYTSVWAPAQRHIQSPAKHLSWNYFAKTIIGSKLLTIFAKISFLDVLQGLEYASHLYNQFSVREQE